MSNTYQRMFAYQRTGVRDNRQMETKVFVERVGVDGPLREVGPQDRLGDYSLSIASSFTRLVTMDESSRSVQLTLDFDGSKLKIVELRIADRENAITSRDLLSVSLPKLVRACAETAIPKSQFWTSDLQSLPDIQNRLRDDLYLLSKLYWFEYITWGNPRVEIQKLLQCQKTTANYYIRLASKVHRLPEARLNENKKATARNLEA